MKFLIELLLFPFYIVLVLFFMILTVLALPLKIPFVERHVRQHINKSTNILRNKKTKNFGTGDFFTV
jgi:membrane protein implicated in regulation of membrane protease activity